jgi:hypothetical protein
MTDFDMVEPVAPPTSPPPPSPNGAGWQHNADGRQYVTRERPRGQRGQMRRIYRVGDETPQEALDRDEKAGGKATPGGKANGDKRPRRRTKRPKMPDPPRQVDMKALEVTFAEAFKAPGLVCASFGDEWAAEHFATSGPYLARNLVLASEHNPWLRAKLEEAATGQDAMMKIVSLVGVGGAMFTYIVPPIIYWFNLPAPAKTREMFGIPDRKPDERTPAYRATRPPGADAGATPPPPTEFPAAAA